IDDRKFGDETWYFVSVYLIGGISSRIFDSLRVPPLAGGEPPFDPHDPNAVLGRDRPYAVFFDRSLSIVLPADEILGFPSIVAATRDVSRAEALVSGWDTRVERVISSEIGSQSLEDVSLVQLIATPSAWIGKRVRVQGYLGAPLNQLFLSAEHAKGLDHASS